MKKSTVLFCLMAVLTSAFICSCNKVDEPDGKENDKVEDVLTTSLSAIRVAAVPDEGEDEIEVKFTVTSNKYWSASLKDVVDDWVYISGSKSFTPADEKKAEEQTLRIKFENNLSYTDERKAKLVISGVKDIEIEIVQEAKVNTSYIRTTAPTEYKDIEYRGAIIEIPIESNVPWKAEFAEGYPDNHTIMVGDSTAYNVLGNIGDTLRLKIRKNMKIEKVSSTLTLTDIDGLCTPLVFTLEQNACPAVQMDTTTTRFCNYSAYGQAKDVVFKASLDWTASISGGNATIDVNSGAADDAAKVKVTFPENATSSDRKATLTVKASNGDQFVLDITQNRKQDYKMEFRPYPDQYTKDGAYRMWRGSKPSIDPEDGFEYYGLMVEVLSGSNIFGYYTLYEKCPSVCSDRIKVGFLKYDDSDTNGNLGYNESGFMIGVNGDNKGGFVEFPAIPGKRLSRVEMLGSGQTDNQTIRVRMQDLEGNTLEGTREVKIYPNAYSKSRADIPDIRTELDASPDAYYCWSPTNTAPNTAYRLRLSSRAMVRWINFYYE